MNTTLLVIDYGTLPNGRVLGVMIPETPHDYTFEEALASIMSGEHDGTLRAVYSIHDGQCEDISEFVADKRLLTTCLTRYAPSVGRTATRRRALTAMLPLARRAALRSFASIKGSSHEALPLRGHA